MFEVVAKVNELVLLTSIVVPKSPVTTSPYESAVTKVIVLNPPLSLIIDDSAIVIV